ncbi:MAG: sigma-70 family RNA polymerase sigma factor [bacterium]
MQNKSSKSRLRKGSVEAYMPLVHSIAAMVSNKGLPPNIMYDDLVSDGTVGLMKAWERFDSNRGVKFETYASYRIRGEMLDGLKNYSPVPYRVQVMVRDLAKKGVGSVVDKKGKNKEEADEDEQVLEKKELSEDEFKRAVKRIKKIVSASALMYLLSVEEMAAVGVEAPVQTESTPAKDAEFAELKDRIRNILLELPTEQTRVVELFFNQGLKQKEISKKLKLSKPKVCRILARAIKTIKHKLNKKHD